MASNHKKNFIVIFLLGISSGIPITLILSTLKALLVDKGFDIKIIGFLSIVSLPYSLKIFVAPIVDSMAIPYLTKKFGNRRSWIIFSQFLLVILIALLGIAGETSSLSAISSLAFLVACISATQDIVIDGYRIELIKKEEQAIASAYYIYGYRIGMLISGSLALALSDIVPWYLVYFSMSAFMMMCILSVLFANESRKNWHPRKYHFRIWFIKFVIRPLKNFSEHKNWVGIILFIICFKLTDAFAGNLTLPFLLEIGYTKTQLATILKTFGLFATLFGVYCGGIIFKKIGIYKSLWIATILQSLSNLAFVYLALNGKNINSLYFVVFFENFCGGIGDAVFVGYLSSICNLKFSSTQYALFSSISSISRSLLSSSSGFYASSLGWINFFIFSALLAIPAIAFLIILNKNNAKKY
ncbi:MAG: AmpG family muropeptide MFS transporter [Alphaproteobacteria bacterium]|nr:AmpG family muropeptide MFS transporter [Alphaproteobacteria bacterium]